MILIWGIVDGFILRTLCVWYSADLVDGFILRTLCVWYSADLVDGFILRTLCRPCADHVVGYCADRVDQFILADYFFAPIDESPVNRRM
jgi:hypothetical protein